MTFLVILALGGILSSAVGRHCPSPPPGINKMRRGVDVTTLDLLPVDLSSGRDGFRRPIIDFTCNDNLKWTNRRQNTYDLPDQIWDILNVPAGWSNANVKIFKSSKEVKKSMAVRVGLDLNFNFGMFSASGSYKKMQHTISQTSSYIEEVSAYDSALKVDLQPAFIMGASRQFKQILDRLPAKFSVNPSRYLVFIKYFGTHYFTSGNFGGTIKLNIETKSSYYKGKSDREIQAQAKASFFNIVKLRGSGSSSTSRVDENFRRSSTQSLRYYGGDTNLLTKEGLLRWQPTVITNPWLFSGELAPITDFIEDPKKKNAMKRAIKAYLNKAYLREMERLLLASSTFSGAADLLKRVKAELEKVEPSQSEVDQLGQKVREDFQVPAWFSADLQLCYNWYADGDGGQCGGGAANTLCALPGQMTPVYRDDTDRRGGGCQMRWGLIPKRKTQPLWFHRVRICYRWYADGDAGQCQSARGSYCAPLNMYTSYYRDDTDRRGGGCRMSWKLEIPSSSPQWLKNAKLCYSWYPDGDGGQCGGGAHRNLCATANTWTGYYRDDTDRRGGGCRMMWGIKLD